MLELVKPVFPVKIELDLLILLDQLYIDSRYPGEMGLLPDGKPTVDESTKFFYLAKGSIRKRNPYASIVETLATSSRRIGSLLELAGYHPQTGMSLSN